MRKRRKKTIPFSKGEVTLLARDVHIVGDIRFSGNLEIEGRVTGNIIVEDGENARVRVGPTGVVKGEIYVSHIVVSGRVEGALHSTGQIELTDGCMVEGNLHYRLLEIEKGAVVNGSFFREQPSYEDTGNVDNREEAIAAIT